jgi:hypothetical protein
MKAPRPTTVPKSIASILKAVKTLGSLKPHQRKRIKEAFTILSRLEQTDDTPKYQKRGDYDGFLRRMLATGGAQLVMVCVLGIGHYALCSMSEPVKMELLTEMKHHERDWDIPKLRLLAEECLTEGFITILT